MNSRDYWALRSAQDMVDRMGTAEQTAAEMNKAIQQSADYIAKEVKAVFRGIESFGISESEARKILNAAGNKTALQSLRAAANRVSDPEKRQALLSAIDSAGAYRYRITRLEQLNKDINAECRKLYKTENRAVTSALKTVANDSYYHSIFNIQQETGLGFSFAKFSQRDVDRILRANWLGGNYSQRIWRDVSATAESMKKELLVSMLSGRSNEKTARIIQERFGVNAYCARRIVRTESAYVANAAQMSAYDEAGVEKYRFIATLDSKTSEVCAALDGKVFPAKDAKPGTNYPPMHPFCRSTTIAEFGEETLAGMERRARDKDGNVVKVPADMGYEEWYRQFVDNSDNSGLTNSPSGGNISVKGFVPATDLAGAEDYAKNTLGIPNVSYKGCDVTTANEWNKGLTDTFNRFPELKKQFGFVGECHERNAAMKPVVEQHITALFTSQFPNTPLSQLQPSINREVNRTMKRMSVPNNTLAQSFSSSIPQYDQFSGITVNKNYGRDSNRFIDSLRHDVNTKFHPEYCDTIRSVLDHEVGHQLDDLLSISNNREVQALYNSRQTAQITADLSSYAWNNNNSNKYSEFIAEAWAEYCNSPQPRAIAKRLGEIIEDTYKTMFP